MEPNEEHGQSWTNEERSQSWSMFGARVPRSEIVFFCQVIIIYTVIVTSIYNLTTGHKDGHLWTALLSSSVGILVPNPTIKPKKNHLPE